MTDIIKDSVYIGKQVKITMNCLNMVASWKYNSENQECKLCHKDLLVPIQESKTDKINGDVTIGTCNHGFHTYCIDSWIGNGNISCPICLTIWKKTKNVGSSVYVYKSIH